MKGMDVDTCRQLLGPLFHTLHIIFNQSQRIYIGCEAHLLLKDLEDILERRVQQVNTDGTLAIIAVRLDLRFDLMWDSGLVPSLQKIERVCDDTGVFGGAAQPLPHLS